MKTNRARLIRAATCAALIFGAVAAQADTYDFVVSGDYSAHWQLANPAVPTGSSNTVNIRYFDATGTFANSTANIVNLYFYNETLDGGIAITDTQTGYQELLSARGPQLYSGPEDSAVFRLGTFALYNPNGTGATYTITITNVTAVPEPESFAMLLTGLSALGFVAARRRKG